MKNYSSKLVRRQGKTAYRTPSTFIARRAAQNQGQVVRQWGLAARMEYRQKREKRK